LIISKGEIRMEKYNIAVTQPFDDGFTFDLVTATSEEEARARMGLEPDDT
jgi:hypothetical protein